MNKELFTFLSQLGKNNNKEWFDANRKQYELLKIQFIEFIQKLINEISKFDNKINTLDAKKSIFRINRDIRFSKDKSPYKTNFGAILSTEGKKAERAGYYIHIEPKKSFIAGGLWQPQAPILAKIRQEIDYNPKEFLSIIENKNVKEIFKSMDMADALKSVPKGFDADAKHAPYLKLKSFVLMHSYSNEEIQNLDFIKNVGKAYKCIYPLNNFLNRVFEDEA